MKILFITDNNLDTIGGEQESTKIILNDMKHKHAVGVLQPGEAPENPEGVEYFELTKTKKLKELVKKSPVLFMKYIWKAKTFIREKKPEVIHSQAQASFFMVSLFIYLRLIPKSTVLIHTERGLHSKYNLPIKLIFYIFLKNADVLVTTTHHNREMWMEGLKKFKYGRALEYRVIENTAGELFEDEAPPEENEDRIHVGFAGRYADWKDWPLAAEIAESLEAKFGEKLTVSMIVGCYEPHTYEATEEMFASMRNLLGDRFYGRINATLEEMSEFYSAMDFYILTSKPDTESFGRTLVEAMSKHTVVLTTNSGGAEEVVGKEENVGRCADDFVTRIMDFYEDERAMKEEKKRNLLRVRAKYSVDNNINKHAALYESKLGDCGSGQEKTAVKG
jgi:glycosyltransferase involved in cell wall biosynthesis